MAYGYYELQLGKEYVLNLISNAIDDTIEKKRPDLAPWAENILDWYEEQFENNEMDWEIDSFPYLVECDLVQDKMKVIAPEHPHYQDMIELFEEEGENYAVEKEYDDGFYVARTCSQTKDKNGNEIFLIKESL